MSQSPQIGACLRTYKVKSPVRCGIWSLNPLKSGPAFGPRGALAKVSKCVWSQSPQIGACLRTKQPVEVKGRMLSAVSIPSNRGLPSDGAMIASGLGVDAGLNPLKSGPAFGLVESCVGTRGGRESQSPQIGACLRTQKEKKMKEVRLRSQSPQIGACLRTNKAPPGGVLCGNGLNPLKSGPAFGPIALRAAATMVAASQSPQIGACLRTHWSRLPKNVARHVSIPSNRGLPSDLTSRRSSTPSERRRLNPLKSGPAFGP